jgi:glutaredoxin 1
MKKYIVYGKPDCSYCQRAKVLLDQKNKEGLCEYDYIDILRPENKDHYDFVIGAGHKTVPQIYLEHPMGIGYHHIGGFNDLVEHFKKQESDASE